jgi:hypothetical protein
MAMMPGFFWDDRVRLLFANILFAHSRPGFSPDGAILAPFLSSGQRAEPFDPCSC